MENPIKMDDLGVPLFLETPISVVFLPKKLVPKSLVTRTLVKLKIDRLGTKYILEFLSSGCFQK